MQAEKTSTANVMRPTKKKKWILILGIVLLLAGIITAIVLWRNGLIGNILRDKNIVAMVGNNNITKQEVQKVVESAAKADFSKIDNDSARSLIMDYWLYSLAAKEYGIKAGDEEALDYLKSQTSSLSPKPILDINNAYVKYRAYRDYLEYKLFTTINSPQKGAYVLAHFDQNITRDTPELKALSQQQYDALIKSDRDYATNFINGIYARLRSGEINFSQAMEIQINDSRIGRDALRTAVMSQGFGGFSASTDSNNTESIVKNPQVRTRVESLKPGDITEPFILKVPSDIDDNSDMVDGIWLIVKVDSITTQGPKFDDPTLAVENFKKKYKYEIYN